MDSAMPDSLRATLQSMADQAGLPIELYAPHYAAFHTVITQMRIDLLKAELAGATAKH